MGLPPAEIGREKLRQQVVDRLKAPEYPLIYSEITGVPVALYTATSVYNTILGRHRKDGQTLGGTRLLDPASLKLHSNLDVSPDISHLVSLTETLPIGLGSAMTDKYAGLYFMYQLLHRAGYVRETEVQSVRRGGGKSLILVRSVEEFKALPSQ